MAKFTRKHHNRVAWLLNDIRQDIEHPEQCASEVGREDILDAFYELFVEWFKYDKPVLTLNGNRRFDETAFRKVCYPFEETNQQTKEK